jgi:hypothetical protein
MTTVSVLFAATTRSIEGSQVHSRLNELTTSSFVTVEIEISALVMTLSICPIEYLTANIIPVWLAT